MSETTLTDTETALINAAPRSKTLKELKKFGLPTRRMEEWHYTDLRATLKLSFGEASGQPPAMETISDDKQPEQPYSWGDDIIKCFFDNPLDNWDSDSWSSVITLRDMKDNELSKSCEPFGKNECANAVGWINSAFATDGAHITIKPNAKIENPICLSHNIAADQQDKKPYNIATRHQVIAEKNSKAIIVSHHQGVNGQEYLASNITSISVKENAQMIWVIDQEEGDRASYLARLKVEMGKNSNVKILVINGGGKLVRQELDFEIIGENAKLEIYGVNLIGGDSHVDVTSRIHHQAPDSQSDELFRNIASGNAKGVFQGQIKVAQPAQLTDAKMACNTLLLSDTCEFSAKPELEIFADDVQCGHGATVFDLDKKQIFYLMARGIAREQARRLLIKAFVASMVEPLENEKLQDAVNNRLDKWMEKNV